MNEAQFKIWVRKNWPGWLASVEPRRGGDIGIPDLLLLDFWCGRLLPVELKIGEVASNECVVSNIRPAQIEWHRKLWAAGGKSAFLVGSGSGKIPKRIFGFSGEHCKLFLEPASILKYCWEIDIGSGFEENIKTFIDNL